ncbi:hypothetical protein R3W88_000915 [Solanum pinnatisectum]|uniref:F-box domain-containing protein n=1 Tax=Solanum pinnatisectum TaxID=50273 RepID=A0AAV9MII0_9SOLN|nr:hypothetical protein R3W88_000915 [Solanum pinnatisectum]
MLNKHHSLPEDLVVDILLRLPLKTLARFKCVCKHWCAFIKSMNFIEKHFLHKNNCALLLVCNLKVSKEEHTLLYSPCFLKKIVSSVCEK